MDSKKFPQKSEVFLLLAQRQNERLNNSSTEVSEKDSAEAKDFFSEIALQMPAAEKKEFEKIRREFAEKSTREKSKWIDGIKKTIGNDEVLIDETIHWSHIKAALQKENPVIQQIVKNGLAESHRQNLTSGKTANISASAGNKNLERSVRAAFAGQFVSLRGLENADNFDKLNGIQLVRLMRLAGIREVAFACMNIEAVESVTGFLRRFAPEDAGAIAANLRSSPKISVARIDFAEELVKIALKREPQPAAMLDWLGMCLIGTMLCRKSARHISYVEQKLPLEVMPKISEIVEDQCRQTSVKVQDSIKREIEELAETIRKQTAK